MTDLVSGLALTGLMTGVVWLIWGTAGVPAAAGFGLLAAVLHGAAVALLKPALRGPVKRLMARWAMGMGLRMVGVLVFAVVVFTQRELIPPLPAAVGYIGVLLPLLFSEMRLLR